MCLLLLFKMTDFSSMVVLPKRIYDHLEESDDESVRKMVASVNIKQLNNLNLQKSGKGLDSEDVINRLNINFNEYPGSGLTQKKQVDMEKRIPKEKKPAFDPISNHSNLAALNFLPTKFSNDSTTGEEAIIKNSKKRKPEASNIDYISPTSKKYKADLLQEEQERQERKLEFYRNEEKKRKLEQEEEENEKNKVKETLNKPEEKPIANIAIQSNLDAVDTVNDDAVVSANEEQVNVVDDAVEPMEAIEGDNIATNYRNETVLNVEPERDFTTPEPIAEDIEMSDNESENEDLKQWLDFAPFKDVDVDEFMDEALKHEQKKQSKAPLIKKMIKKAQQDRLKKRMKKRELEKTTLTEAVSVPPTARESSPVVRTPPGSPPRTRTPSPFRSLPSTPTSTPPKLRPASPLLSPRTPPLPPLKFTATSSVTPQRKKKDEVIREDIKGRRKKDDKEKEKVDWKQKRKLKIYGGRPVSVDDDVEDSDTSMKDSPKKAETSIKESPIILPKPLKREEYKKKKNVLEQLKKDKTAKRQGLRLKQLEKGRKLSTAGVKKALKAIEYQPEALEYEPRKAIEYKPEKKKKMEPFKTKAIKRKRPDEIEVTTRLRREKTDKKRRIQKNRMKRILDKLSMEDLQDMEKLMGTTKRVRRLSETPKKKKERRMSL